MRRRFDGDRLVIASHNPGKVAEIAALLDGRGIDVVSAAELNLAEPEETGETFIANAALKAHAAAAAAAAALPALADDSGLCVAALGDQPGIDSARWAGPDRNFRHAMEKVQTALGDAKDRRAHFVCVLALAWPDWHLETCEGTVHSGLTWPPRGDGGFGYDPMFVPDGYDITFGEMDPDRKHALSHRANAFAKLMTACFAD